MRTSTEVVEGGIPTVPADWTRTLRVALVTLGLVALGAGEVAAQNLVINEISASNSQTLDDEDGDFSDWLEIYNADTVAVDLDGFYLTDDAADLRKWRFPSIIIPSGGYIIVFASDKDRAVTGEELHASFRLDASGEYLALVAPDGLTVLHEYAPTFPRQREDITYGLTAEVTTLVGDLDAADVLVPLDGTLGDSWTATGFAPGAQWQQGVQKPVGYYSTDGGGAFPPPRTYLSFNGTLDDQVGPNDASHSAAAPNFAQGFDGTTGGAIEFGGGDYVTLQQNESLPIYNQPAYTIAMWVKGGPQADDRVYSEGSTSNNTPLFNIGTEVSGSTGQVDIFIRSASSGTIVSHRLSQGIAFDGNWHHIAWVDVNGDARLYIDGELDPVDFSYPKEAMQLDVTALGAVVRSGDCCWFDGAIDEVGIWDQALNEAEIALLADGSSPGGGSLFSNVIETDIGDSLRDQGSGVYMRLPFRIEEPIDFTSLSLRVRYDDGFVAYLNGQEVASRNAPANVLYNSQATAERADGEAIAFEEINLSDAIGLLQEGDNVLAVHGLNLAASDEDFLLDAELVAASAFGTAARYFEMPTPGSVNQGGFVDFVGDTTFSVDRGFYEEPITVEITSTTPGAEIRYTIDGTAPSAVRGEVYEGPLLIDTTTTLRAMAHRPGFVPTNVDTQTYVFLDDVIRQPNAPPPGYPSVWQGFPADYGMDPEICLDEQAPHYAPTIKDDLKSIPTMSLVLAPNDLMGSSVGIYTHSLSRGVAWERAASIELIDPSGSEPGFQVNCGVRMQGNSSARPGEGKHSFRLIFKAEHGPTKLRYPLFPDSEVERFDTITLRCMSTDSWHFKDGGSRYRRWDSQFLRDVWMKDSQLAMGHLSGHNRYVHLYVNGMYWGLYNPTERPDDDFNASYHGGEDVDWDVVKDFNELFRGNKTAWNEMMALAGAGLGSEAAYQRIQGNNPDGTPNPAFPVHLDVDNLIDYMMLHLYAGAEDWPHHNWYAGRNRTGDRLGWQWYVWDQEIVMDFVFRDRIGVSNTGSPAFVYSQLRANEEFRLRFGDRVHRHLFNGGALTDEAARARWNWRADEIDRAVIAESARWGDYRTEVPDPRNSPAELYTREGHWLVEKEKVLNEYIPESRRLALARFRNAGLYPPVEAPSFNQHGGLVDTGFELTIGAPSGVVYYTLDGSDPRLTGGDISPTALSLEPSNAVTLFLEGVTASYRVPAAADAAIESTWMLPEFADDGWSSGSAAIGYDRNPTYEPHIDTDVGALMDGVNPSVWIRIPFEVSDPGSLSFLALRMKYDDGFAVYLNGERVGGRNDPEELPWDAQADGSHSDSDAVEFETVNLDHALEHLRAGSNVLAIHGLNVIASSSDFLCSAELIAAEVSGNRIPIEDTTLVRSRTLDGATWSAVNEAVFSIDPGLRITEIHYHPAGPFGLFDDEDFEFLELQNLSTRSIDLTRYYLDGAVGFDFAQGAVTSLEPGEIVLVVRDLLAFESRYDTSGMLIAGEYSGRLDNAGEAIFLFGEFDETVLQVIYDDAWYPLTDGEGPSLVVAVDDPEPISLGDPAQWRPSAFLHGSPGASESDGISGGWQRPGDGNQDGLLDIGDAVAILVQLFSGAAAGGPPCEGGTVAEGGNVLLLDATGDAVVDISDAIHLLQYMFLSGEPHVLGTRCVRIEGCENVCTSN